MSETDSQRSVDNKGAAAVHHKNHNNNKHNNHNKTHNHKAAAYKHHDNNGNNQNGGRKRRRTRRRKQRGGRRNAGVIRTALAAALVPFGLFAAQKKVQKSLPTVSVGKTKKRKTKLSRKTARRSKK